MTPRPLSRIDAFAVPALAVAIGVAAAMKSIPARAADAPAPVAAPVHYWRAENVAKSFASGAVLFDEHTNYMIHTSRRDQPGQAEVHGLDTDLIHVLEGTATFVTGGRAVDLKSTAPDEWRGASIEGGDTRELAPGDVIIVPAGVPHWFKDVHGPLLYYTVKVRNGGAR